MFVVGGVIEWAAVEGAEGLERLVEVEVAAARLFAAVRAARSPAHPGAVEPAACPCNPSQFALIDAALRSTE